MRSTILPLLLLFLPVWSIGAGDAPLDRGTLRGLTAVNVVIDPIPPDLVSEGVRADDLQGRLEGRLQNAGIKVDPNAKEFVALRLLPARQKRGPYAVAVTLGLYQPVLLSRDQKIRTATETWEIESVIVSGRKELYGAITDTLEELANGFTNAYRSVNPQEPTR